MSIHELYCYLRVRDGDAAVAFYKDVFGAVEDFRLVEPSGRIGHVELNFAGTIVMLSEEFPELGITAPPEGVSTGFAIHLHVDNADEQIDRAVEGGATLLVPPTDFFYGERSGKVRDPFGFDWIIGHSIEDVSTDEMQRRYSEM